jgi:hypothetical protein
MSQPRNAHRVYPHRVCPCVPCVLAGDVRLKPKTTRQRHRKWHGLVNVPARARSRSDSPEPPGPSRSRSRSPARDNDPGPAVHAPPAVEPPPLTDPFRIFAGGAAYEALREPVWEGSMMSALTFLSRHLVAQTSKHISDKGCTAFRGLVDDAIDPSLGRTPLLRSSRGLQTLIEQHCLPGYKAEHTCPQDHVVFVDSPHDPSRQFGALDECPVCQRSRWAPNGFRVVPAKVYHRMPLDEIMANVYARKNLLDTFLPTLLGGIKPNADHITQTRGFADRMQRYPRFALEPRNMLFNFSADGVQTSSDPSKQHTITIAMGTVENIEDQAERTKPENMVIFFVAEGPNEPKTMQGFMDVLTDDFVTAWKSGYTCVDARTRQPFLARAMVLNVVSDYMGMVKILNRGSPRANKGCAWCEVRGFTHAARACFPCSGSPAHVSPLRTKAGVGAQGDDAERLKKAIQAKWGDDEFKKTGVRGRCALDRLEYFDSTVDALLDMMHAVSVTAGDHLVKSYRGQVWTGQTGNTRLAKQPADPRIRYGWGGDLLSKMPKKVNTEEKRQDQVRERQESMRKWQLACGEADVANADARPLVPPKHAQERADKLYHKFQGPTHLAPGTDRDPFQQKRNMKAIGACVVTFILFLPSLIIICMLLSINHML